MKKRHFLYYTKAPVCERLKNLKELQKGSLVIVLKAPITLGTIFQNNYLLIKDIESAFNYVE